MSSYPADMGLVAQKLATKIADLQYQLAQMEVLAETFRNQRDTARNDLSALRGTVPHNDSGGIEDAEV